MGHEVVGSTSDGLRDHASACATTGRVDAFCDECELEAGTPRDGAPSDGREENGDVDASERPHDGAPLAEDAESGVRRDAEGGFSDGGMSDGEGPSDSSVGSDARTDSPVGGVISGGPCLSGAVGATAFRVRWNGTTSQPAYPTHEIHGLPDHSRGRATVAGYSIGFRPPFVGPFLGEGGLLLDPSDFVDIVSRPEEPIHGASPRDPEDDRARS